MPTESLPAFAPGNVAVITGAASGIGLAAAMKFAGLEMKVVLADLGGEKLDAALKTVKAVAKREADVLTVACNVQAEGDLATLRDRALAQFGSVSVLMNNAGIGHNPGSAFKDASGWRRVLETNLFGVVNGVQAFLPSMIASRKPGLVISTGSKQGITTPPGNLAYNIAKAGVKVLTEGLAHELRNIEGCRLTAHLLIPGHTFTAMTARSSEKPPGAWTPQQVVDFMLESLARGDFYILCPDNDVSREMDERRVLWAAEDIIKNRPALSRWHGDHSAAFEAFMQGVKRPR